MRIPSTHYGVTLFVGSLALAAFLAGRAPGTSIAIVPAGLVMALVVIFQPMIRKRIEQGAGVTIGPKGIDLPAIPWRARQDEPYLTVIPKTITDSTANEEARRLCNEGRRIVFFPAESSSRSGETNGAEDRSESVDLNEALSCFAKAVELDPNYWEPRLNIAQIKLLQRETATAMAIAAYIHVSFWEEDLAFAKSRLIIAKVMELQIPKGASDQLRSMHYSRIARFLRESLARVPGHMTTRTSLGKVLLKQHVGSEEVATFLADSLRYKGFTQSFLASLESEGMRADFEEQFPGLLELALANTREEVVR